MSDALTFLSALWPLDVTEGSHLVISTMAPGDGVHNHAASSIDEAAAIAEAHEGQHVWINVAARSAATPTNEWGHATRGTTQHLTDIPALWADLDVAEGAPPEVHKGNATFDTFAEAHAFLAGFVVPPSMIVRTGYGLSAWWILGEPEPAVAAKPVLDALKATVTRLSEARTDPAVYDTARMMRLPGTLNVKVPEDPKACVIVSQNEARYSLSELEEVLDLPPATPPHEDVSAPTVARAGRGEGRPGDDYDEQATTESVVAMLLEHGCTETHRYEKDGRLVVHLARPDKDPRSGHSMTVGYVGPAVTHMFSSNWDLVPLDTYKPYRLYARLYHRGDTLAAVRDLAGQGYGRQLVALDKLPKLDGLNVSRDFVAWLDGDVIITLALGWLVWDGTRFSAKADGGEPGVSRLLMTYVDALEARAVLDLNEAGTDEEKKKAAGNLKRASGWLERGPRERVLRDVRDMLTSASEDLDADPELLNVSNGIVNLRTGELIDHDRKYKMTKIALAEYDPQRWTADWVQATCAVTGGVLDWLQVAVGMGATGYASADKIFVAHGEGGGGKSTFLGSIRHVLGDYGVVIPQKLFTAEGSGQTQALMDLRGARMALAAESGEDHYLNMERLKAVSGGDAITDRKLYATETVTWRPSHYMWLMTNYRPKVRNSDEGTWRRLVLIPFNASFRVDPDEELGDRLELDPANRSAILSWIVRGAVRWFADGKRLPPCPEVEIATEEWREAEDRMSGFMAECFEITGSSDDRVGASELYQAYRRHVADEGSRGLSAANFKAEMERYAERLKRTGAPYMVQWRNKKRVWWCGLRATKEIEAVI